MTSANVTDAEDNEINKIILKAMGYVLHRADEHKGFNLGTYWTRNGYIIKYTPDYYNDLNAMHEAELFLQREMGSDIWLKYLSVLSQYAVDYGGACSEVSATARQRAEAFIQVLSNIKS